jgi:YbgC/YbaW family acyl-CoA thioester hydrolase
MSDKPQGPFRRKIRYSDTDLQGVVFNANYFVYFDDALTDFLSDVGLTEEVLKGRGHDITVAHAEADFKAGATFGDVIVVTPTVERLGTTSISIGLEVFDESTGHVVAAGREIYVILDRATGRPTAIPDYIREAFSGEEA